MAALILIGSAAIIPILSYISSDSVSTSFFTSPAFLYALTFILGCSFPTLLSRIRSRIARRLDGPGTSQRDAERRSGSVKFSKNDDSLYGLDHAILNVPSLEVPTMWMNMGYWRNATQLPQACEALVEKVLENAGLWQTDTENMSNGEGRKKKALLDLGIGCGQQTLYLMNRGSGSAGRRESDMTTPLFDRYIGITIDKMQYDFAKRRVDAAKGETRTKTVTDVFCADAADPSSWPCELQDAISSTFLVKGDRTATESGTEGYVLALDTLYHFRPSRREIFKYSHSTLQANFLAFDMFLARPPSKRTLRSIFNSLFLRLLTPGLSAPFSNFITFEAYKLQLQEAGYAAEDIAIEDITDDVFPGLATFLETRKRELAALGLTGFSKWRISGWLFRWLAAGDVLRAGVVVARRKRR